MPEAAAGVFIENDYLPELPDYIRSCADRRLPMVAAGEFAGRPAVICGSGPSLVSRETLAAIRWLRAHGWTLFACKESIRLLCERGIVPDFSVSIDPTEHQPRKTHLDRRITYLIASSCHPVLFDHVLDAGCRARVFHSLTTAEGENALYRALFPPPWHAVTGGNVVVNRAFVLAGYMGFNRRLLAGADYGWREDKFDGYAQGAEHPSMGGHCRVRDRGWTDGQEWFSRPEMLTSAVGMAHEIVAGRCDVIGDSLAASLARHRAGDLDGLVRIS